MAFAPIPEILDELKAGRMIVLVDDERRENEGDLICAAQFTTPDIVNQMTKVARGMLCVAVSGPLCDKLELAPQAAVNTTQRGTALTVSVDAQERYGITTGVSAFDRATTIAKLADPQAQPHDFVRPGHVNPVRARDGGVLVRTGQTEGSVDLCKLADLQPAAAMIEVMNDDGTMARRPELVKLCEKLGLKMCSVADVVAYRLSRETLVRRGAERDLRSAYGEFRLITYASGVDPFPHVALCRGRVGREPIDQPVLVRVHAQNVLGDVFGDLANPTARSLIQSLKLIDQADEGALLYIRQDDLGAGLNHLPGVCMEDRTTDRQAVEEVLTALRRDARFNVGIGSQIIRDLGIRRLRLLTDHPQQYHALGGFDLQVSEFVPLGLAEGR